MGGSNANTPPNVFDPRVDSYTLDFSSDFTAFGTSRSFQIPALALTLIYARSLWKVWQHPSGKFVPPRAQRLLDLAQVEEAVPERVVLLRGRVPVPDLNGLKYSV